MIKDLIKLADQLDKAGLNREAEFTDKMIAKLAVAVPDYALQRSVEHVVVSGETMASITEGYSSASLQENIDLNKTKNSSFGPDMIKPKQKVWIYVPAEYESN